MTVCQNLGFFLDQQCSERPQQNAIIVAGKKGSAGQLKVTYKELTELTKIYAAGLRQDGVGKGARVLVMITPSVDLIAITWALFRLGAVPILMDPGMGIKRLIACIRRSKPEVLIGIPRAHLLSLTFKRSFSHLKKRITVGPKLSLGGSSTRDYLKTNLPWTQDEVMDSKDLSAILFTSGSTGSPKGVCYLFEHFVAQVQILKDQFNIKAGDIDLPLLPIFALFNPSLGLTSVLPRIHPAKPAKLDPEHILDLIETHQINHSFGAPVLWQKIIRHAQAKSQQIKGIRQILIAGSDVSPDLVELIKKWAPNAKVITPYGATECLPISMIEGDDILKPEFRQLNEAGQGNCVGQPIPGMSVRIIPVDKEAIDSMDEVMDCLPGKIGEIIVRGSIVTTHYDHLKEETKLAKISDGEHTWHRMGDLGYFDAQGYLWYCGRLAHMVETSKGPLYSVCVEAIFNRHPDVFRSALISLGGKAPFVPAVVVELENGSKPETIRLCLELQTLGAKHSSTKSIRNFYIHPSFPVDVRHNAKIHRIELGKWAAKQDPLPSV